MLLFEVRPLVSRRAGLYIRAVELNVTESVRSVTPRNNCSKIDKFVDGRRRVTFLSPQMVLQ